jgi:sugar/nucleoside kinase (ribokinase family)
MRTVVTSGEILVEIMATAVGQSFLEPGPLVGPFPSGAPAIFIDQCGRLGQPCGLISAVGEDDFGMLNLSRLKASGVDVSAVAVLPDWPTGSAFVRYHADGGRSFVFNIARSAAGQVALGEAARRLLARADHFHVMGTSLGTAAAIEVALAGVEAVKARGGTVSFDPNLRPELLGAPGLREALDAILARCDIFLPSGAELFLFTDAREEGAAVAELLGRGIAEVVVKKGAGGAVRHGPEGVTVQGGFAVEEVDPTGAGDCFGAAYVCLRLRGASPAEALRLACACGALAVTRKGPMEGTPTLAEAERFMAERAA